VTRPTRPERALLTAILLAFPALAAGFLIWLWVTER
jgi:hypothetical protein